MACSFLQSAQGVRPSCRSSAPAPCQRAIQIPIPHCSSYHRCQQQCLTSVSPWGWGSGTAAANDRPSLVARSTPRDEELVDDDDLSDIGLGPSGSFDEEDLDLPLPDVRYQRVLPMKERKQLRAKAETMAKQGRLLRCQIGQLGITEAFLRATSDMLQKHELVRVKLGEGCGLERKSAAKVLEKYLDAVCVHQIGFTVTLYRQQGLPRPSNTPPLASGSSEAAEAAAAAAAAEAAARAEAQAAKEAKKKKGQQRPEQRPPEFSVL